MLRFRRFLTLAWRFRSTPIVDDDFPGMRNEFDGEMKDLRKKIEQIPEVICLCGSTRFKDAYYAENKRLTQEGKIVLSVGDLDQSEANRNVNVPCDPELKARLDDLHKRKIDISDRILVLNVGGYVGESTRSEIEYAERVGVPVTYLEPPSRGA